GGGGVIDNSGEAVSARIEPTLDSASIDFSTLQSDTTDAIEFQFEDNAGGVLTVDPLGGTTPPVGAAGPAVVDTYDVSVPEDAEGTPVTVSITVRPERVQQVGASPENLVVKSWSGSAWREAETTVQRTDSGIRVTARLSTLTQFLAVATPGEAPSQTPGATPDEPTATPPDEATPPPTDQPDVPTATPVVGSPTPGGGGGLVGILLPVVLLLVIATGLAVAWVLATQNVGSLYERFR
ncbi:MAG: hypothetical protein ABEJ34_07870, partial [Haloferacaceae archaeon]